MASSCASCADEDRPRAAERLGPVGRGGRPRLGPLPLRHREHGPHPDRPHPGRAGAGASSRRGAGAVRHRPAPLLGRPGASRGLQAAAGLGVEVTTPRPASGPSRAAIIAFSDWYRVFAARDAGVDVDRGAERRVGDGRARRDPVPFRPRRAPTRCGAPAFSASTPAPATGGISSTRGRSGERRGSGQCRPRARASPALLDERATAAAALLHHPATLPALSERRSALLLREAHGLREGGEAASPAAPGPWRAPAGRPWRGRPSRGPRRRRRGRRSGR